VPELVGDLAGGQFAFVEQGGAGLAEYVAGDLGELAAAAGLAQLAGEDVARGGAVDPRRYWA
jgi:hypothetical protein